MERQSNTPTTQSPAPGADPPPTVRLSWGPAWLILAVALAAVPAAIFIRGSLSAPDRPWFPLLLLTTLAFSAMAVRRAARMWRRIEFHSEPSPRFRVVGLFGRRLHLDVSEVTEVQTLHRIVPGGSTRNGGRSDSKVRLDMVVRGPERPIVVSALGPRRGRALNTFAASVAAETMDGKPKLLLGLAGRRPERGLPEDAQWLNRDLAASGPWGVAAATSLPLVVLFFGFAAAIGAGGPTYDSYVSDSDEVRSSLVRGRNELGVGLVSQSEVDAVELEDRPCDRDEEWLWGESGGVVRLEGLIVVPVDVSQRSRAAEKMAANGTLHSDGSGGWINPDRGPIVSVEFGENDMAVSMRIWCLHPEDRAQVQETFQRTVASTADWLVT